MYYVPKEIHTRQCHCTVFSTIRCHCTSAAEHSASCYYYYRAFIMPKRQHDVHTVHQKHKHIITVKI